jgi:hypothetical protein
MKKALSILLLTSIAAIMLLTTVSCGKSSGKDNSDSSDISDNSADVNETAATYSFNSILKLKNTIPSVDSATVLVKGYYTPGDGGGGMFYWDAESELTPDNGLVIAPKGVEKGRFIRICDSSYRNVKWFGAAGTGSGDDTAAIKNAIASLPSTGGTIAFPGGIYNVSETINIGNGDGGSERSTINGIKLIGEGGGFGIYGNKEPTVIKATKEMDVLLSVNGRIADVTIEGLFLNGGDMVNTCLYLKAVNGLVVREVSVKLFKETGIYLVGGTGNGNGNNNLRFETVSSVTLLDNGKCIFIDGDEKSLPTENCVFIDCRFDTHTTANSTAGYIRKATKTTFYRCHFARYNNASDCLVLDASTSANYPFGNVFYDCSVGNIKVIETESNEIGNHFFYGHGTYDNEEVPAHRKLAGITDTGVPFGMTK